MKNGQYTGPNDLHIQPVKNSQLPLIYTLKMGRVITGNDSMKEQVAFVHVFDRAWCDQLITKNMLFGTIC